MVISLICTHRKKNVCKHLEVARIARNGGGPAVCLIRSDVRRHTLTREAKTQKQVLADVREKERRTRSVHGSRDGTTAS